MTPTTRPLPRLLPLIIAAFSMMGPFSIDAYLPSFREIEHSLGTTQAQVQQTLTAFLIPFAFMSLWHGALSDALGRRRVIISALSAMALASIGCALARSIEALCFFRILQGLFAGVFVVGRAVVRDVYEGPAAQRVMSQISVLFAIAPAIAPVLGGQLHVLFGWRSVFLFLSCFAGGIALWSAISLPETHPVSRRHPLHAGKLLRAYFTAFTHPGFLASALAGALSFAALFLYVAAAPVLLPKYLHLPETRFAWLFIPITSGLMLGGFLSGRLAGRLDATHTLAWAFGTMMVATVGNVAFHTLHAATLPWSMLPLFLYATGVAVALPTLTLIGLDYFPRQRGLAASCNAFALTAANAGVSALAAVLSISPQRVAMTSGILLLLGLGCVFFVHRGEPGATLPIAEADLPAT